MDAVTAYADDVVAGRYVVGELERLACERHLRDLETARDRGFYYDPEAAARFFLFAFKHCRHWKGSEAGKRVRFEPWQLFSLGMLYGWQRLDGSGRRFSEFWKEVAKKNGKSTEGGAICLYGLTADREAGPEVYPFATRRDQAKIVFNSARRMALRSPALKRRLRIGRSLIECPANDGEFAPIGADADSIEGKNPHIAIGDEIHLHKSAEAWENMETAQAARDQPILAGITTAGDASDLTSLYNRRHDYAVNVLKGVFQDDRLSAYIARFDADDDFRDESIWVKANPNIDVSVKREFLRAQFDRAARVPSETNNILRKHGNLRTQTADKVIDVLDFRAAGDAGLTWAALAGRPCFAGIDLSSKIDLSAIGWVFPPAGPDPHWRLKWDVFISAETDEVLREKSIAANGQYMLWRDQGHLDVHEGARINHEVIRNRIKVREGQLGLRSIGIDPWHAAQLGNELQDQDGFEVFEVRQGFKSMGAPTREFVELSATGGLGHDGNPIALWSAGNLAVRSDPNGNQMPDKARSAGKIDPLVASIIGFALAMAERDGGTISIPDDYEVATT